VKVYDVLILSEGNAYFQIQGTRPQTIASGLTDSPVGQLAWIVEKFKEWTHPSVELPEKAIDRDRMLTNMMLYWLTAAGASSAQLNYESMHASNWPRPSTVATGVAVFAEDIPIRRFAEQANNIVHWSEFECGVRFAAMEAPELLFGSIREFLRGLR
jgi:hypothetical protein